MEAANIFLSCVNFLIIARIGRNPKLDRLRGTGNLKKERLTGLNIGKKIKKGAYHVLACPITERSVPSTRILSKELILQIYNRVRRYHATLYYLHIWIIVQWYVLISCTNM